MATHFSTVHPQGGGIDADGSPWTMQDVDYERARGWAKWMNERREHQIDNLNFNIQGSTAAVTFNQTLTSKDGKFGGIGFRIEVENQVLRVIGVTPESAAFEAGIQAADVIIKH